MELLFDPVIPLLGIYPNNPQTLIRKNICTPTFIVALFTVAKMWKQPECSLVDEWIKSCGTFTPWNITQPLKRGKSYLCNNMEGPGEHYA